MKKLWFVCISLLLLSALVFSGCAQRESAAPAAPGAAPFSGTEKEPAPTSTPVPTPIPYDAVAEAESPRYAYLADADSLAAAREALRANAAEEAAPEIAGAPARRPADAPDIIAAEGDRLYILSEKDLIIAELAGEETRVLSRTRVGVPWSAAAEPYTQQISGHEKTPIGLFCLGDRLAVLGEWYGYESTASDAGYTEYISADIYDVSDPAQPVQLSAYGQEGALRAAGVAQDCLYLITEYDFPEEETALPSLYAAGGASTLDAGRVLYAQDGAFDTLTVMSVFDMLQGNRVGSQGILGVKSDPCAAEGEIWFASPRSAEAASRAYDGFSETAWIACTDLFGYSFDRNSFALAAAGTVNGTVTGSRCLDVHNGVLRCLTALDQRLYSNAQTGENWDQRIQETAMYLLDGQANTIGRLAVMPGSVQADWVGYVGETAIATSFQTEQSLLLNLSDPIAPAATEPTAHSICGDVLLPWGDGFVTFLRESAGKLTLRVYDAAGQELGQRTFGSDHSSTLENIRGYLADTEYNFLGFSADDSYSVYTCGVDGIEFKTDAYLTDWAWNSRGFAVDGYLYIADTQEIMVYDAQTLEQLAYITPLS